MNIDGLYRLFSDTSGPVTHIAPSGIGHFMGITITNSMLFGWACALLMFIVFTWVARRITVKPKGGFTQFVEIGAEFIVNTVESAFEDKSRARKYIPYFVTLFFFLLVNNWLGTLPGTGDALTLHGAPFLRPYTGDLNATLAAAVITMGMIYISSVREAGGFGTYLSHFFVGNPRNPMYLALGLMEMFSDITRVISLSLRLFLNIAIGEIVIAVFAYLGGHFLAPFLAMPFTLIDLFDGALQAFIFTVLSTMYLAIAVNHATQHEREHQSLTESGPDETMGIKGINLVEGGASGQ